MWRDTSNPVKILFLDARACFPMLACTVYYSWHTLEFAIVGTLFFSGLSWAGLTVSAFLRLMRRVIVGSVRPAVPSWQRRRFA